MLRGSISLLLMSVAFSVSAQNVLLIEPDPEARPVGTPQSLSYASGAMRVRATSSGGVEVSSPLDASPRWSLLVAPSAGDPLAIGCFERSLRFGDNGRPSLDFSFGSSGCGESFGRYRVLELERDGTGNVSRLALDFAQQCGRYGPAVRGKLRLNSVVPTSGVHLRPVTDQNGTFSFTAAQGAIGSSAPGGSATISLTRQTTVAELNFDNGFSFSYFGPLPGVSGNSSWSADFAAPNGLPLDPGAYPSATRFPFQADTSPGLDFGYNGLGCNTLVGSFNVTAMERDALDGLPIRFLANFQQRCNSASGALTSGTINYASNIVGPTSAPNADLVFLSGFEAEPPVLPSYFVSSCQ